MIAVALGLLLWPLLRQGRASGRSRGVFVLGLAIALLLPLAAAALYLHVGTPLALNGVAPPPGEAQLTLPEAIRELRAHLAQQPSDVQGWMLLAQTSTMQRDPATARDAYDHVLKLNPDNTDAMVGWAETDSMLRSDHMIQGRAMDLLKRALKMQPDSQRGLWLLGIAAFQHGQYADAAATWRVLQKQLEPGSQVASAVAQQIALADARIGGATAAGAGSAAAPAQPTESPSQAPPASGASLRVEVSLAPALQARLVAGDTLYVYARAPSGPPMPLAVARLDASLLPVTVTLSDAMAMTPNMKLSSLREVFVGARISHSGQPIAQPGDLEGNAGVVPVDSKQPVIVRIDKVH